MFKSLNLTAVRNHVKGFKPLANPNFSNTRNPARGCLQMTENMCMSRCLKSEHVGYRISVQTPASFKFLMS
jgi:hypothetical protein